MNCTASVRKIGDVAVVDLNGRFTIADSPGLIRGTVAETLESGTRNILLNLEHVTYLDSAAGIGELISSYSSAVRQDARLKLLHTGKNIDKVLHLTHLDTIFEMFDDEETAIKSFRNLNAGARTE
jgi:anti-sigma B factor antagonist